MARTYHELKEMTVAQLREMAKELNHEAVRGYSQMNKDHLLPAICRALNIESLEHHTATGVDRPAVKAKRIPIGGAIATTTPQPTPAVNGTRARLAAN